MNDVEVDPKTGRVCVAGEYTTCGRGAGRSGGLTQKEVGGHTGGGSPTKVWKNEFKSRPEALLSAAVLCADALDPAWDPATQGDCAMTPVGGMEPLDKCGEYSCGEYEPPLTWPQLLAQPGVTAAPCWEPANGFLPAGVTDKKLLCKHKNGLGAETTCHVDIFATGLRNAYGLTFDSAGQLWAANNGHSTDGSFPNTASQCGGFITATEAELQVRSPRHRRPSCCVN